MFKSSNDVSELSDALLKPQKQYLSFNKGCSNFRSSMWAFAYSSFQVVREFFSGCYTVSLWQVVRGMTQFFQSNTPTPNPPRPRASVPAPCTILGVCHCGPWLCQCIAQGDDADPQDGARTGALARGLGLQTKINMFLGKIRSPPSLCAIVTQQIKLL